MQSIYLYPSICLFEGTIVSEGRGTYKPFQQFGMPAYTPQKSSFVPKPIPSMSSEPKFAGKTCYGYDLSETPLAELQKIHQINLDYLLEFYQKSEDKENFFRHSTCWQVQTGYNNRSSQDKQKKRSEAVGNPDWNSL